MTPAQKQTEHARAARHVRLTCGYTLTPKAIAALSPVMPVHGLVGISIYTCGCSLYRFSKPAPAACPMHGRRR